jgi:hypothetical protein
MSQRPRRHVFTIAVVSAVIIGAGAVTLPALAEDDGAITGHLTDGGVPVVGVSVNVYDTSFSWLGGTGTDGSGAFTFANLAPGGYKLEFFLDGFQQWTPQKLDFSEAGVIQVNDGEVTVVEEELLPHGGMSGHITNPDGTPAAGASVAARANGSGRSGFTTTDADGAYALRYLLLDQYVLEVSRNFGTPTQFAHGAISRNDADLFPVTAGATTTVDEQLLATGALNGRLTAADGSPVPNAFLHASNVDSPDVAAFGSTDGDGRYALDMFPGDYTLAFETPYGTQWATGRSSAADADPITVIADQATTHDETLAALGTVAITAVEQGTGTPVTSFCASLSPSFNGDCTEAGSLTFNVLPGSYEIGFSAGENYVFGSTHADVTSGATTSVVLELVRAATVTTTILDRQSGAAVENACVELVRVIAPTGLGNGAQYCSDASGAVTVPTVTPGTYVAFVWANGAGLGHQWVGKSGGTGEFEKARTFTLASGQALTLPSIRLDPVGGNITGTITDEANGAPAPFAAASLSSYNAGQGPGGGYYPTDGDGHYTISGLGPYKWTLFFSAAGYAYEWSGDAATRASAKPIKVKTSGSVTANAALGRGTTVSGIITGPTGIPADGARITFLNADSRDEVGVTDIFNSAVPGQYTAQVKGVQRVKVGYYAQVGQLFYSGYVGGDTFEAATTFTIPANGAITINVPATNPSP